MRLAITVAFSLVVLANTAAAAGSRVQFDQDDALANLALETAATVCDKELLLQFVQQSDHQFQVTLSSQTLPSGLKSAKLTFDSARQQLVVIKPYVLLSPSPNVTPVCSLSTKGLARPQ